MFIDWPRFRDAPLLENSVFTIFSREGRRNMAELYAVDSDGARTEALYLTDDSSGGSGCDPKTSST